MGLIITIIITIAFLIIPLVLLYGIERGIFRRYRKAVADQPKLEAAYTMLWLVASLLGLLPSLALILFFAAEFDPGLETGLGVMGLLLFGWIGVLWQKLAALFTYWEPITQAGAVVALALIAFHWFMEWHYRDREARTGHWKTLWPLRKTAGIAASVLLIFAAGYGVLGAYSQTNGLMSDEVFHYRSGRAYDSDTKSNLHNVYLACKAYWADNGSEVSCDREFFTQTSYGYIQSMDVQIEATGTEKEFRAAAFNINSDHWFWMDELGAIQPLDLPKENS